MLKWREITKHKECAGKEELSAILNAKCIYCETTKGFNVSFDWKCCMRWTSTSLLNPAADCAHVAFKYIHIIHISNGRRGQIIIVVI